MSHKFHILDSDEEFDIKFDDEFLEFEVDMSDESTADYLLILNSSDNDSSDDQPCHGGSTYGKKENQCQGLSMHEMNICMFHLNEKPMYTPSQSACCFRIPMDLFKLICDTLLENNIVFYQHEDAASKKGASKLLKFTAMFQILAYGDPFDY